MPDFSPAQPWRAETRLIPSKAAGSGATEAYPRGYVARRHTTENDAGGFFQQPSGFDGDVNERRHTIRSLLIRHPQLKPVGPFL